MLVAARAERLPRAGVDHRRRALGAGPAERPHERATAADERHAKFADERSDFLAFLKLWKVFDGKLEKTCRENFLSSRAAGVRDITPA